MSRGGHRARCPRGSGTDNSAPVTGNLVPMAPTRDDAAEAQPELGPRIAEVYGGALAGFVARRDALARELKAAGRRDEAAEVKALRKPKALAWALDAAALADPEALAELVAAVENMSDAQTGDGDVRAAIARLRAAEDAMVTAAGDAARGHDHPVDRTAVAAALRAVVGSPDAVDTLRAGRLVDTAPTGDDDAADTELDWSVPADRAPRRQPQGRAAAKPDAADAAEPTAADEATAPAVDRAAIRSAQRAIAAAERAATKAEAAADKAASDADDADAAARAADDDAVAARRRADELAAASRRAHEEAQRRADERDAAAAELARARAELDDLGADA